MIAFTDKISLNQQIEEIRRVNQLASHFYQTLVATGVMEKGMAASCQLRVEAGLKTLEWLQVVEKSIPDNVLASAPYFRPWRVL